MTFTMRFLALFLIVLQVWRVLSQGEGSGEAVPVAPQVDAVFGGQNESSAQTLTSREVPDAVAENSTVGSSGEPAVAAADDKSTRPAEEDKTAEGVARLLQSQSTDGGSSEGDAMSGVSGESAEAAMEKEGAASGESAEAMEKEGAASGESAEAMEKEGAISDKPDESSASGEKPAEEGSGSSATEEKTVDAEKRDLKLRGLGKKWDKSQCGCQQNVPMVAAVPVVAAAYSVPSKY